MLKSIIFLLLTHWLTYSIAAADDSSDIWLALKQTYFGDKTIRTNAADLITLVAPKRAEDPAIVPINIVSNIEQSASRHIKQIHIFIDDNPMPYVAKFTFHPALNRIDISTRVRVDRYSLIRVIAEMQDDSLHMVKTFIKASGGCSAPASKDSYSAKSNLGQMQIRMRQPKIGSPIAAQVLINHPNNSGLQIDQVSRGYIPAHYIKEMIIHYNNAPLISMEAGISISENPSLRFVFTPNESGMLHAEVTDSKNLKFQKQKKL